MPPITDYAALFALAQIAPDRQAEASEIASAIIAHRAEYDAVSAVTGALWWWIGCIHTMECGGNFRCHLHNGDPLTARTVHVPAGRPLQGAPVFAWHVSAIDALQLRGIGPGQPWALPDALGRAEAYNGMGYRNRGLRTPYLWAATTLQQPGKYVADGVWSDTAMSDQIGVAAQMLALHSAGVTLFG